jgi:orotidine-5'-phosphate decarboxylase
MDNKPIIALDVSSSEEVNELLQKLPDAPLNLKVGMELFYQEGPQIVKELKALGHDLFLDIKLHDIPTTVRKAMVGIARLGVDMINMHAAGGKKMMEEARRGLEEGTPKGSQRPLLIAVTQLTSTTEEMVNKEQRSALSLEESAVHFAKLANEAGADGVVCSAHEAKTIKEHTREDFLCVTPGIRLKGDNVNDQARVASPKEAQELGSTHIVIGRSVTLAKNPLEAYQEVVRQWNGEVK